MLDSTSKTDGSIIIVSTLVVVDIDEAKMILGINVVAGMENGWWSSKSDHSGLQRLVR